MLHSYEGPLKFFKWFGYFTKYIRNCIRLQKSELIFAIITEINIAIVKIIPRAT